MNRITLLIAETEQIEATNYLHLGNELFSRGVQVTCCFMDSIAMLNSEVVAQGFMLTAPFTVDAEFPDCTQKSLTNADCVWVLNLGMRHSFLDKIQLLNCLPAQCRVINSLDSLVHLKSKYFLASHADVFRYPATYSSSDPKTLLETIRACGGKWIAKPPAGSLGRDVFLLSDEDPNTPVILESMTGPDSDQFCMIQPYVAEIEAGEKRVLLANGKPVGQYLRTANNDHRTNVSAGSNVQLCDLTAEEIEYCEQIGAFLVDQGAIFVGLDLAYPWVIEFNVVNPGGIQTIIDLGGNDLSAAVIDEILRNSSITA